MQTQSSPGHCTLCVFKLNGINMLSLGTLCVDRAMGDQHWAQQTASQPATNQVTHRVYDARLLPGYIVVSELFFYADES